MRKLLSVLLILAMVLSLCSCKKKKTLEEIKQMDGVMLTISEADHMPWSEGDEITGRAYYIYYDGTLERRINYKYAEKTTYTSKLSDEELYEAYEFCYKYGDGKAFENYSEGVVDGTTVAFLYRNEEGITYKLYDGYCYHNKILSKIRDMARDKFYPDHSLRTISFLESYYDICHSIINLHEPEVKPIEQIPSDAILTGEEILSKELYVYTYHTAADADLGPIDLYLSGSGGPVVAISPNREWKKAQISIRINNHILVAELYGDYRAFADYLAAKGELTTTLEYLIPDEDRMMECELPGFKSYLTDEWTYGEFGYFGIDPDGKLCFYLDHSQPYGIKIGYFIYVTDSELEEIYADAEGAEITISLIDRGS